jgi:urea transport system permease protein
MIGQILDIVTSAALLYVISVGLLLIFGVMKIINFAHGGLLTLGGYAPLIVTNLGLNPWWALPLAMALGGVVGMVIEQLVVRPLYRRPLDAILATWGLSIMIGQLITLMFGRGVQFAQTPLDGTVQVLGTSYSIYRLSLVPVALILGCVITALLNGTRLGLSTRAVIMNESLARGLGINSALVRFATFAIGSALAGLGGALITPLSSIDPNMGVPWLMNAFMLVLVSGTSLATLAFACLLLGGCQVLVSAFVSPILGGLTIAVLAAVLLRLRPEGLARA